MPLTKRRLGIIAATALLSGLALVPAAPASAAQVTEYTIQIRTESGGSVPIQFRDWAANTKLTYASSGQAVQKGALVASGQQLRFWVDPTASNGIWIDMASAFVKFWPSQDSNTSCLRQNAVTCAYNAATRTVTITSPAPAPAPVPVYDYTVRTRTTGGGSAPVLFKDWAANTKLSYSNGTEVQRGAWISAGTTLKFQVDPSASNGLWIDTASAFLKFWPTDSRRTQCLSAGVGSHCEYAPDSHTLDIVTNTAQRLEWTIGTTMAYGGSTERVPVTGWSANAILLHQDGTAVARGELIAPNTPLRVIVNNAGLVGDASVQWWGGSWAVTMTLPTSGASASCSPSDTQGSPLCFQRGTAFFLIVYNGGN